MGKWAELESQITNSFYYYDGFHTEQTTWEWWKQCGYGREVEIPGVGTVSYVDSFGGEDQGTSYWVVVEVKFLSDVPRYFRKDGHYSSYSYEDDYFEYGSEMTEVTPKEKVITEWETK